MAHRYSVISNDTFRKARKELPNKLLELWVDLELGGGSDDSGSRAHPNVNFQCHDFRYYEININDLTRIHRFGKNYHTRVALKELKRLEYIIDYNDKLIILPLQGDLKQYFQNYASMIHTKYWKLIAVLLSSKKKVEDSYIVQAGIDYLRDTATGSRMNMSQKYRWVREALKDLEGLGIISKYGIHHPNQANWYEIHLDVLAEFNPPNRLLNTTATSGTPMKGVKTKKSIKRNANGTITKTKGSADGTITKTKGSADGTIAKSQESSADGTIQGKLYNSYARDTIIRKPFGGKTPHARDKKSTRKNSCQVEVDGGNNNLDKNKITSRRQNNASPTNLDKNYCSADDEEKRNNNIEKELRIIEKELELKRSPELSIEEAKNLRRKLLPLYRDNPSLKIKFWIHLKKAIRNRFQKRLNLEQIITNISNKNNSSAHDELIEEFKTVLEKQHNDYKTAGDIIYDEEKQNIEARHYSKWIDYVDEIDIMKYYSETHEDMNYTEADVPFIRNRIIEWVEYEAKREAEFEIKELQTV